MKMILQVIRYSTFLTLALLTAWFCQDYFYSLKGGVWSEQDFVWDYGYNIVISLLLGVLFVIIHFRQPEKLGYSYLGSISVKFILFFIFIYPDIRSDDEITKQEFANFFIPFSVCLVVELLYLISLLRKHS